MAWNTFIFSTIWCVDSFKENLSWQLEWVYYETNIYCKPASSCKSKPLGENAAIYGNPVSSCISESLWRTCYQHWNSLYSDLQSILKNMMLCKWKENWRCVISCFYYISASYPAVCCGNALISSALTTLFHRTCESVGPLVLLSSIPPSV